MASNLTESIICNICDKIVLTRSIFCDLCQTWIHTSCLKFNKKTISILSKDQHQWYCPPCLNKHLPFSSSTNYYVNSLSYNSSIPNVIDKCDYCNLNIITSTGIKCYLGKHYFHMKCVNLNRNKLKKLKNWSCESCNTFPFSNLNNDEFREYNSATPIQNNRNKSNSNIKLNPNFSNFYDYPKLSISPPETLENEDSYEVNFDYYNPKQFNKITSIIKNNLFSVFHTNIRSYQKSFEHLSILLNELKYEFDVIGLTETWHTETSAFLPKTLKNYHDYEFTLGLSQNGGCGVYIKNNINFKSRADLSITFNHNNEEFESTLIEILNQNSSNIIIGVVYRHPTGNDVNSFINYLKTTLKTTNKEKKKLIIMGDFNIDLLKVEDDQNKFIEIMLSNFLQPYIIQPTRITENGKYSLIDNIFYNKID